MDKLAEELQAITEKINPTIERAERALARLYPQPPKRMEAARTSLDGRSYLVFFLLSETWRLVVLRDGRSRPLVEESRETRLRALMALPDLVGELETERKIASGEYDSLIEDAHEFVQDLESRGRVRTP